MDQARRDARAEVGMRHEVACDLVFALEGFGDVPFATF